MLPSLMAGTLSGHSRIIISLANVTDVTDTRIDPLDATAGIQLENDGDTVEIRPAGNLDIDDWITPKSQAGNAYEARVTVNTGTLSSGTSGSWLALDITRSWTVTQTVVGTKTANITLEIRKASTGVVMATKTFNLTATVSL